MRKKIVGFGAILMGILLILQNTNFIRGDSSGFVAAGIFILLYLVSGLKNKKGFVVFLAIGIVSFFQNAWDIVECYFDFNRLESAFQVWIIALAFFAVHAIHYSGTRKYNKSWAKTVGIIMTVIGAFVLSFDYLQFAFSRQFMVNIFPISLIIIGGVLFLRKDKNHKDNKDNKDNNHSKKVKKIKIERVYDIKNNAEDADVIDKEAENTEEVEAEDKSKDKDNI